MLRRRRGRPAFVEPLAEPGLVVAIRRAGLNIIRVQTQCQGMQRNIEEDITRWRAMVNRARHVDEQRDQQLHIRLRLVRVLVVNHIAPLIWSGTRRKVRQDALPFSSAILRKHHARASTASGNDGLT
jgi:hypothetical protein